MQYRSLSLFTSLFGMLFAFPAFTQPYVWQVIPMTIEWEAVPGSYRLTSMFGSIDSAIGVNTIVRNGDAINFDFFESAEFTYARFAGNCETGWLLQTQSGYYDGDTMRVRNYQRSISPSNYDLMQALDFACAQ